MTDSVLTIVTSISFLCYVFLLANAVRRKGQQGILTTLKSYFLILTVCNCTVLWILLGTIPIMDRLFYMLIDFVLFITLCFAYILCLFGIPLSSVRMQALATIAQGKDKRVREKDLLEKYSTRHLVDIRLYRLESSKEIIKKGKYYMVRSPWSYFMIHNQFLMILVKLYKPIDLHN